MSHAAAGQWLLLAAVLVACFVGGALVTYVLEEIRHEHNQRKDDQHGEAVPPTR